MVRFRIGVVAAGVALALGGLVAAAFFAWPDVRITVARGGLAHISLPGFAGSSSGVEVAGEGGANVPVQVRGGTVWPLAKVPAGERLTVSVQVRRPGWIGWLVGGSEERTLSLTTPAGELGVRWLEPKPGAPVKIRFDVPVSRVSLGGNTTELARPRRVVSLGVVASGASSAGRVKVAAAARSWETLSKPVQVSWFVVGPKPKLLAKPRPGVRIGPGHALTLTFSRPVAEVLGSKRPTLKPATPGKWRLVDGHTLSFVPSGLGFPLGATIHVKLPAPVVVPSLDTAKPLRLLRWSIPAGSQLRLQELLATLGYLPLSWQPAQDPPATAASELQAAISPPVGTFTWRYPHTPASLKALWQPGKSNEVTRAAIMTFEDSHDLPVDGLVGAAVWRALIQDALQRKRHTGGYSYVFVHEAVPQNLNLWHNGKVIVTSPGNTGIASAPTQTGTWPVFEHIPVGTMSGTNPDGSHYNDPGVQWISYFHGGDALHAFPRASYGTPQSLGCVELPADAAAQVWPYTPIGTLVTIEN
ncbi:MAG: L,D-transpeptidase family protein [Gaiellaceae bacterium]